MFHPQTAFFLAGLLYIALPLTAWSILKRRHDGRSVALWCLGGGAFGLGATLIGLRDTAPHWLSFAVANPLIFGSYALRTVSLKRELGMKEHPLPLGLSWLLASALYLFLLEASPLDAPRVVLTALVSMLGSLALANLSWRLFKLKGFRSAAMLSGAYALFASAMLIRSVVFAANWRHMATFSPGLELAFSFIAAIIAALYGNLGYIGIALETAREKELVRTAELSREQEKRAQVELHAREISALLEERTHLLAHREEMLGVLAHEVRQPLNNASAALQSATAVLAQVSEGQEATKRLTRANTVLLQVTASLDNALADAVLLDGKEPLTHQDTDIDTLIALVVAGMSPDDRQRVRVERTSASRTADMNSSLIRLALRNLIANALAYSPPGSEVIVRVRDSDEPLGLIIDVHDRGPGLAPELLGKLFTRGTRGSDASQAHGHGLGLYIVQRVMQLHGGKVAVARNAPGDTVMRLELPQIGH